MLQQMDHGYLDDNGEYIGNYEGCRVTCEDCKFSCFEIGLGENKRKCNKLNMVVNEGNNICNQFHHWLINPNKRKFNYDEYFEWLMNDYYRPYKATNEIAYYIPRPSWYQYDDRWEIPVYKTVDCLWCTMYTPDCHVHIGKHNFVIDYHTYKDLSFMNGDEISYKRHYYKEKKTSKKYTIDYYGRLNIKELEGK